MLAALALIPSALRAAEAPAPVPSPTSTPVAVPTSLPLAAPASTPPPATQAAEQADAALVDPLTPNLWFSLEDESLQSVSGASNQLNLRAQIPLAAAPPLTSVIASGRVLSLIKFKLPIVISAPSNIGVEAAVGTGDLTVAWLGGFGSAQSRWAGGASFKFPTGAGSLGSGKWSVGPAIGYTAGVGAWTLGVYSQSFFSYAGSGSRAPVAQTQIEPTISYAFADGWSIGSSQMKYTYDYDSGRFTNVPLGVRVSKQMDAGAKRWNAYFEAEKNLATSGGTSWSVRLGAKLVFLRT